MSVIFGRWNFDGRSASPDYVNKVRTSLAAYGPDSFRSYSNDGVTVDFHAFHTTKQSRNQIQPFVSTAGPVLAWDGRLDNRKEIIGHLGDSLTEDSADVCIVAGAYERWTLECFGRLIGDWALSIWNPVDRSVILAKDPLGPQHLYYSVLKDSLTWSTVLDPLVLYAGQTFALDQEYIAGCLSLFPASHLTPYVGIRSVPSSSFVRFQEQRETVRKYWDFDPAKTICYKTDAEYEDHFRTVFAQAVRRRLRSDAPVLAELSGGMDSSSIVCMADLEMSYGAADAIRLDTVSYFDDSEPGWDEYPYFTKVEDKRGRTGCHIDVSSRRALRLTFQTGHFAATPLSLRDANHATWQFAECVNSQGNRVVLSGIGGDEVTGGVPTPTPELENLLVAGRFRILARQLKIWALIQRRPWFYLFFEAVRGFFPSAIVGVPKSHRPPPWLNPIFERRHRQALSGYHARLKVFGPTPSFQENLFALEVLRRQMACSVLTTEPLYEKRYPYLDRDLLEFLYAVPREQIVRPGQRRSLMRRALAGIVPPEILNRKRKATVARGPTAVIASQWPEVAEITKQMVTSSLGMVASGDFVAALENARGGREVPIVPLFRTLAIESWLRNMLRDHCQEAWLDQPADLYVEARRTAAPATPALK
jgi:asparagine synthase (glutamine-hydrolysing)